jgi:putative ATP-dependent endonuclease of OLD family
MQILALDPNQSDKPIDVDELGEGARNMILIALLRSYAKNFKNSGEINGILALEEPELFLHPQAKQVYKSLFQLIPIHLLTQSFLILLAE